MARGWESKDVESQLEEKQAERAAASAPRLTPEQIEHARRLAALELDHRRVTSEIAATRHPRRRQQLEAALRHLETEIAKLSI